MTTPNGTSIQIPNPIWSVSIPVPATTVLITNANPSQQAANICQLCYSQGHHDYQCQFAGNFMARTQKAFNQGRSYSQQDPNNGEWSQGDGDNNDPNGQPFQKRRITMPLILL